MVVAQDIVEMKVVMSVCDVLPLDLVVGVDSGAPMASCAPMNG